MCRSKPGNDETETKDISWTPPTTSSSTKPRSATTAGASSLVCFLLATFGWAFGFYGQSVYVAELQRLHGWPASLISSGTTFFYLFGAALVAFVSEAIKGVRPRNCMIAGICTMAVAAISIGQVREPWQLYLANAVLAFGWAGTSLGMITNTLGPLVRQEARHGDQPGAERRELWRHRRRAACWWPRSAISASPAR